MSGFSRSDRAGEVTEYGVEYVEYGDAHVPFVTTATEDRWLAASVARRESATPGIRARLVERTVTYGRWQSAEMKPGDPS
jgi:hypothetical protein